MFPKVAPAVSACPTLPYWKKKKKKSFVFSVLINKAAQNQGGLDGPQWLVGRRDAVLYAGTSKGNATVSWGSESCRLCWFPSLHDTQRSAFGIANTSEKKKKEGSIHFMNLFHSESCGISQIGYGTSLSNLDCDLPAVFQNSNQNLRSNSLRLIYCWFWAYVYQC